MIIAELKMTSTNVRMSRSLLQAVRPDNEMGGLIVKGKAKNSDVSFEIVFEGRIETFISTLDDFVQCLQAAKETLSRLPE